MLLGDAGTTRTFAALLPEDACGNVRRGSAAAGEGPSCCTQADFEASASAARAAVEPNAGNTTLEAPSLPA
jgi:hypothetical protein